jgi:hypothetical protein
MKGKAYLHHIYCKVKDQIQRRKQFILSDQDVHVYEHDRYSGLYTRSGWVLVTTTHNETLW